MWIVAIDTGNLSAALSPTFGVRECRDLVGDQKIVGHGIFDQTEAGMATGAGLHLGADGQLLGIHDREIRRLLHYRREMVLPGSMAAFAGNACVSMSADRSRFSVTRKAFLAERRTKHPAN
jgi:hypothetical protein